MISSKSIQFHSSSSSKSGTSRPFESLSSKGLSSTSSKSAKLPSIQVDEDQFFSPANLTEENEKLLHAVQNLLSKKGDVTAVKALLADADVDVTSRPTKALSLLFQACEKGKSENVRTNLKALGKNAMETYRSNIANSLHVATKGGFYDAVVEVVKYDPALINFSNNGWTPLSVACQYGMHYYYLISNSNIIISKIFTILFTCVHRTCESGFNFGRGGC